ncbi:hypothetical protein, partial [Mesorhizobium sp. M8A.F.Ca.ET.021.01.1.1]|uniref:hypothetical protein n=1 Tax=Mesorhizobium sp. M8A.F.Ca.ET.021.01.1.1 TaxID=2496757 RepID=UPI001AED0332
SIARRRQRARPLVTRGGTWRALAEPYSSPASNRNAFTAKVWRMPDLEWPWCRSENFFGRPLEQKNRDSQIVFRRGFGSTYRAAAALRRPVNHVASRRIWL